MLLREFLLPTFPLSSLGFPVQPSSPLTGPERAHGHWGVAQRAPQGGNQVCPHSSPWRAICNLWESFPHAEENRRTRVGGVGSQREGRALMRTLCRGWGGVTGAWAHPGFAAAEGWTPGEDRLGAGCGLGAGAGHRAGAVGSRAPGLNLSFPSTTQLGTLGKLQPFLASVFSPVKWALRKMK